MTQEQDTRLEEQPVEHPPAASTLDPREEEESDAPEQDGVVVMAPVIGDQEDEASREEYEEAIAAADGAPVDDAEDAAPQDEESYEEVDEAALLSFEKVRPQIMAVIERDEHAEALQILEQIARFPDTTRHVPDNVWLYTTLGMLRHELDDISGALQSYETAYGYDPREIDLLLPYAELLLARDRVDRALNVLQSLLLYHKRTLSSAQLVEIYCQMGTCYERQKKLDKARLSYEKALELQPGQMSALEGLLQVVNKGASPQELVNVRQRLIKSLKDAPTRSRAMVSLGDDFIERLNDPQRALDMYEQAFNEDPEHRLAVERIAKLASELGDWRRVSRAYFTLSRLAAEPSQEAEWLIKASLIARDQLWEPEKALSGFKRALELDPSRLDAFKIVTSILVDTKDWDGLKKAYISLIASLREVPEPDTNLMVVLWQNLGELYRTHLDNKHEALIAFDQASQLLPQSLDLHEKVAQLAEKDQEFFDLALVHLKAMRLLQPTNDALLDRIGRVYLRKKEVDHAYCIFRTLAYRGAMLDDKAAAFVERFQKPIYKAPKQPLTPELMQRYIFHPRLDRNISRVFEVVKPPLAEWAGQTRQKYGLGRRDQINLSEQLTFNNIYRSIGELLQYPNLPELWRKSDQVGLINGALVPDGMIVGDDLLGSGREKQIAFIIGKQLFLFLSSFYLAAIRPTDLQAFYLLAKMLASPEQFGLKLDNDLLSAYKAMQKGVSNNHLDRLRVAVKNILQNGQDADVDQWREAVEDSANRAGLVFCDDLKVCEDYLNNEAQRISKRTVQDRMSVLSEFAISEEYVELRSILGINVA